MVSGEDTQDRRGARFAKRRGMDRAYGVGKRRFWEESDTIFYPYFEAMPSKNELPGIPSKLQGENAPVPVHMSPRMVSIASAASSIFPKANRSPDTFASATRRSSTEALVVPVMPTSFPFSPSPPPYPESFRKRARSADSSRRLDSSEALSLLASVTAAPHACRHPTTGGSAVTNGRIPTFSLLRVLAYRHGQARTTADPSIFNTFTRTLWLACNNG